jgi:hypothetical protein
MPTPNRQRHTITPAGFMEQLYVAHTYDSSVARAFVLAPA